MKKLHAILIFLLVGAVVKSQPCIPNTSALIFDGSTGYVFLSSDNGLAIGDSVSVEAWVLATSWAATSAQNSIFCKHSWTSGEQGYVLRAGGSGVLSFNIAGIDSNGIPVSWVEIMSPSGALSLNTWTHVAGTYDGNNLKLYVNGAMVATLAFKGTIVPSTAYPARIGALSDIGIAPSRYWSGLMDEIRVWHSVRTQSDIQANMNMHIDPSIQTSLAGYWRFNESSGTTTGDLSANGNNGTLNNVQWTPQVPFNNVPVTPSIIYNFPQLSAIPPANSYQWYLNGNLITGATQQNYTPQQNGVYTVTVTNAANCTASSAPYTFNSLSIDENSFGAISVFYNSAEQVITVNVPDDLIIRQLELTGITGKSVSLLTQPFNHSVSLPVKNYSPGIYFVKILCNENLIVKRIVKN